MGEVYRARDTRLDRTVAVTILPTHLSDNSEARQRFELRSAAAVTMSPATDVFYSSTQRPKVPLR